MTKSYQLPNTNYQLTGRVIRGDGYGQKLGFPTANIDRRQYVRDGLKIKLGIWSGVVQATGLRTKAGQWPALQEHQFKAAIVIGPVDKYGLPKLEAHLIGFKGNLYGKKISIILGKYLRPFKKFKNEVELIKQIKKDLKNI